MQYETVVLTGATGYLGNLLIPHIIETYKPHSLRLFARSEWKLAQILRQYNDLYDMRLLRPLVGDIRDRERVFSAIKGADLVIHTAALKRLEICNYNPQEAIKTNVVGSMNVMDACVNLNPHKAIFISSDKAYRPKNLYGITKACMEEMVRQRALAIATGNPTMTLVRYGNVIGSTGAVIPYFINLAKAGLHLPITDPRMTRFLITKKVAWETVKWAIENGKQGEVVLPTKIKSMKITDIAETINALHLNHTGTREIGMFSGEKLHEELDEGVTSENVNTTKDEFREMLKEDGLCI